MYTGIICSPRGGVVALAHGPWSACAAVRGAGPSSSTHPPFVLVLHRPSPSGIKNCGERDVMRAIMLNVAAAHSFFNIPSLLRFPSFAWFGPCPPSTTCNATYRCLCLRMRLCAGRSGSPSVLPPSFPSGLALLSGHKMPSLSRSLCSFPWILLYRAHIYSICQSTAVGPGTRPVIVRCLSAA